MNSTGPSQAVLDWAAGRVGASTSSWVRTLHGGEHAVTNVIVPSNDESLVLRQFPVGDTAVRREIVVLGALDSLAGLAPRLLAADVDGAECGQPTILTSLVPGVANITPRDPIGFAQQLGQVLARIHAHPPRSGLREIMATTKQTPALVDKWELLLDNSPVVTHNDFWSGNTLWQDDRLTGVVDWSGAGLAPRGFDVSWARLDLILLYDETIADAFTQSYEQASGNRVPHLHLWDLFAGLNAQPNIESWAPNYQGLGREDLGPARLRHDLEAWLVIARRRGKKARRLEVTEIPPDA